MFHSVKRRGGSKFRSFKSSARRWATNVEAVEARTLLTTVVTYTVQGNSDTVPAIVVPSGPNAFSANTLRAAIDSANAQPFPAVIQFNAAKFTGGAANTIALTSGLTLGPATPGGEHAYKLVGPTAKPITVSGGNAYTNFTVAAGVAAEFNNLTIAQGNGAFGGGISSEGRLTLFGNAFVSNVAASGGGGVYSANGLVSVSKCTFAGNSASQGGGIYIHDVYPGATPTVANSTFDGDAASDAGGAIYNLLDTAGVSASLVVSGCTFADNGAGGDGGAIYSFAALPDRLTTAITGSTFAGASAGGNGGAIYSEGGRSLTLGSDTFTNDTAPAGSGGAIYVKDRALSIAASTFAGTSAFDTGGAAYFESGGGSGPATLNVADSKFTNNKSLNNSGGALHNASADAATTIANSTFTGNFAYTFGGAIYSFAAGGSLKLVNDTISNNTANAEGGAVYSGDGALAVTGGTFANDRSSAQAGGAIYQTGAASVSISKGTFTGNTAFGEGGALHLKANGAIVTIADTKFANNSTNNVEHGGAVYSEAASLAVSGSSFTGNHSSAFGGGLYHDTGDLTVTNSTFAGNSASSDGGAIADNGAGTTIITRSTFDKNSVVEAGANGGALASNAADLRLADDAFTGNAAIGLGGAAYFNGGTLDGNRLTLAGNVAAEGGALYSFGSESGVFNSTFSGNTARFNNGNGGAVHDRSGTIQYANDTFNGNRAGSRGGALYLDPANDAAVTDSTIAGNSASFAGGGGIYSAGGDVTVNGSIVARNFVTGTPAVQTDLAGANGFNPASDYNLIGNGLNAVGFTYGHVGGNFVGTDFAPIDPLLGALADNGGPTKTMRPASGSLAIGNGADFVVKDQFGNDVTAADQRGVARPQSQGYDIGAYQSIPKVAPSHFVFVGVPGSATKDKAFTAKVEIRTPGGALDHAFLDAVTLSSTDAAAGLSPVTLHFVNGVASFSATLKTVGQQKLKVTDVSVGSLVSSLSSSTINVKAASSSTPSASLPTLRLGTPATVRLPSSGTTTAKVPVLLGATTSKSITVTYTTIGKTASYANGDYVGVTQAKMTIPAGSKAGTYYLTINGVKRVTGKGSYPKTFQVRIDGATNATLQGSLATVTLAYP